MWILYTRNTELVGLSHDDLESKKLAVCGRHFVDTDFKRAGDRNSRLSYTVIPKAVDTVICEVSTLELAHWHNFQLIVFLQEITSVDDSLQAPQLETKKTCDAATQVEMNILFLLSSQFLHLYNI